MIAIKEGSSNLQPRLKKRIWFVSRKPKSKVCRVVWFNFWRWASSWSRALLILRVWKREGGGGGLVFWDSRVLELNGMEIGHFSISCRFKNVRDGFCWEA